MSVATEIIDLRLYAIMRKYKYTMQWKFGDYSNFGKLLLSYRVGVVDFRPVGDLSYLVSISAESFELFICQVVGIVYSPNIMEQERTYTVARTLVDMRTQGMKDAESLMPFMRTDVPSDAPLGLARLFFSLRFSDQGTFEDGMEYATGFSAVFRDYQTANKTINSRNSSSTRVLDTE